MISAFRLCKTEHLATAFFGEGARLYGGRWNSPGISAVYAASSLSLATLEILVHLEDPAAFAKLFSWVPLEIPEECVERLDLAKLTPGWSSDETNLSCRALGDAWLNARRAAVLAVPSVVTPGEWNYLMNPMHAGFPLIRRGTPQPFCPDKRLFL